MLALRLYRLLLWAYPPALRIAHGDEMTLVVMERWRDRPGVHARLTLIVEILADFVRSLPRAWRLDRHSAAVQPARPPRSSGIGHDVRHAARSLRHAPWFTAGAALTLALGIGASTAIFSLARATLLHPLAIDAPERVVQLSRSWSHVDLRAIESHTQVFSGVAAWTNFESAFDRDGKVVSVQAAALNGRYFETLGVVPLHGRLLTSADDEPGATPVMVLGERFWRRMFGADPGIIGSTVRLGRGTPAAIVGVVPSSFRGLSLSENPEIFVAIRALPQVGTGFFARPNILERTDVIWIQVAARLRAGVRITDAERDTDAIYRAQHPPVAGDPADHVSLTPITATALGLDSSDDLRRFVFVLGGATLVTLLLACATVANLLLVRGEHRQRELAIRSALGAGRARTARLLLVESLMLGAAGGIGGLAIAQGALSLLEQFDLPGRISIDHLNLTIDTGVFAAALVLGLATSLVFGAAPIWQSVRLDLIGALREGSRGSARQPLRAVLVTVQVALAVLLLAGSFAFGRAVSHAVGVDFGFETSRTAIVSVDASVSGYPRERIQAVQREVLEALALRPDIAAAAWSAMKPLRGRLQWRVGFEGVDAGQDAAVDTNIVSAGYFAAMRIPIVAGRNFTRDDVADGDTIAVTNETGARRYWPAKSAVDTRIDLNAGSKEPRWARIVGVVADVRHGVSDGPTPMLYLLDTQHPEFVDFGGQNLIVRGVARADVAAREAAEAIAAIDPRVPIVSAETMAEHLRSVLEPQRLGLMLFALFAGLAVVLTALGLYALVAYAVAHRTREIGIRVALGADRTSVVGLVVRQGLLPVGTGLVAGSIAFRLAGNAIARFLFAVPLFGGWAFVALAAAVGVVAILAMIAPARRALRIDPVAALRND